MLLSILNLYIKKIGSYIGIISEDDFNNDLSNFVKNQGIIFIKLIQILSSQKYFRKQIGNNLYEKFVNVQDNCNQNNFYLLNDINYLENKPVGSGSLCQVFKINYQSNVCALKVKIPNAKDCINNGILNINFIKNILFYLNTKYYNLLNLIDLNKFHNDMFEHLKLDTEAKNIISFYEYFNKINKIIIPKVLYFDKNKIIMSYENGIKFDQIKDEKYRLEALFLICSFHYLCIKNNLIHGDFHDGNFLFKFENNELKIIILDFGVVHKINENEKNLILKYFDIGISDEIRSNIFEELCNFYNIKFKSYNLSSRLDHNNFLEEVDIYKIPKTFLVFGIVMQYFNLLQRKRSINSLIIKLFNYMYKNKFIEV